MVPVIEGLETHDEVATVTWPALGAVPAGWPEGIPFLADRPATMLSVRGSRTFEWDAIPEGEAEVVARRMVDDGWVETTLPDVSMPGMRIRPFRRGDRQRVLIHDGRMLSLLETRAE